MEALHCHSFLDIVFMLCTTERKWEYQNWNWFTFSSEVCILEGFVFKPQLPPPAGWPCPFINRTDPALLAVGRPGPLEIQGFRWPLVESLICFSHDANCLWPLSWNSCSGKSSCDGIDFTDFRDLTFDVYQNNHSILGFWALSVPHNQLSFPQVLTFRCFLRKFF